MSFENQAMNWFKKLQNKSQKSFKRIRSTSKRKETEIGKLLEERKGIIKKLKTVDENEKKDILEELVNIVKEVSDKTAEENRNIVVDNFSHLSSVDGTTNHMGVWKIKKKVFPKCRESLPFAKKNIHGKLVSTRQELKQLYLDTFTHRLRHRPIKPDFGFLKSLKEELCKKRLTVAVTCKSSPWDQNQLNKILTGLKNGKSCDPHGLIKEIFKTGVCGQDLQSSLWILMNKI